MASYIEVAARAQCQMVNLTQLLLEESFSSMQDYRGNATTLYVTTATPLSDEKHVLNDFLRTVYFFVLSSLSHAMLLFITIALSKRCFEVGLEKTSEHAFYCTLAFVLLIGECILVRSAYDIWAKILSHQVRDLVHIIMAITALFMGIYGIGIKYLHKRSRVDQDGKKIAVHFRTQHGFYGILGPVMFLLTILIGFATYFLEARISFLLPLHRFCGLFSFLLLSIAQFLGYNTGFARRNLSELSIKWYKFLTVIVFVITIHYAFRRMLKDIVEVLPKEIFIAMNLNYTE